MGNSSVTPTAAPGNSVNTTYFSYPRWSASVFNTADISTAPAQSPIPTFTSPTNYDSSAPPPPIKSPTPRLSTTPIEHGTFATPIVKSPAPFISTSRTNYDSSTAPPIKSPSPHLSTTPTEHRTFATPIVKSPSPFISTSPTNHDTTATFSPVKSPAPHVATTPTKSSTPSIIPDDSTAPIKSPYLPVFFSISTTPVIPVTSSTSAIPVDSPTSPINDNLTTSSNLIPVISPDTSVVSPTLDIPISPLTSPTPTAVIPANTTTPSFRNVPTNSVKSGSPVKSITPQPSEVVPKRITSKTSRLSFTTTSKSIKPITSSSTERWDRWNKFGHKQRDKHSTSFHSTQQSQSLDISTPSPINTNKNQILNIIPVPSYTLRATAVCTSPHDDHLLLERTQSIHKNISIFKYHLTEKETKLPFGNHTQATMFKMNTRLKQTPLPTPCLSFLSKNFSDGIHEMDDHSITTPTFDSLGLQTDLEAEQNNPPLTKLRSHEKKVRRTSSTPDFDSDSINSLQFVSSSIISQPNSRPPLTSILKKPTSQIITNPYSKKADFENNPFTVSFNLPLSPRKASQSIFRSEKLMHRKK